MKYQNITNLLGNTPNQPTKFRTKNWVETDDESRGTYNSNSQFRFESSMLRSGLCNYGDAYILVSATIIIPNTETAANPNNRKNIIIETYAPFTNFVS